MGLMGSDERRLDYKYYFDGPHFPEIGMALYCEKGKASLLQ